MAKYKKKRARELQHDRFRDTTMGFFDRLGELLEGKGRTILYGLGGLILAGLLVLVFVRWSDRKADEASEALGRAISISTAGINPTPIPGSTEPSFATEYDRAQRAIEEFEKVAAKYGDPYQSEARYFIAANRLVVDRAKGLTELSELSNSSVPEVAALSKFALAQAKESDGKLDEAAQLYSDLARQNSTSVTAETANLRLAKVYTKLGKKQEAVDVLFDIVKTASEAKDLEGKPVPLSPTATTAKDKLTQLDPEKAKELPQQPVDLDPGSLF